MIEEKWMPCIVSFMVRETTEGIRFVCVMYGVVNVLYNVQYIMEII